MSDIHKGAYCRLSEIFAFLVSRYSEGTAEEIARETGVELYQTQMDLWTIRHSDIFIQGQDWLEDAADDWEEEASSQAADEWESEETWNPGIRHLDPFNFGLGDRENVDYHIPVYMTDEEKAFLADEVRGGDDKGIIQIKENVLETLDLEQDSQESRAIRAAIRSAMAKHWQAYCKLRGKRELVLFQPCTFYQDMERGSNYEIGFIQGPKGRELCAIPLRDIRSVKIKKEKAPDLSEEEKELLHRYAYVWGRDDGEAEEEIRLLINAETKNILPKIRGDVHNRLEQRKGQKDCPSFIEITDPDKKKMLRVLFEVPEDRQTSFWVYRDRVIGKADFLAWVSQFGSSVALLEPKTWAEEMKEMFRKRVEMQENTPSCTK